MSVDRQNYDRLVSAMAKTDIKEPTYAEAFPPLPMNNAETEPFPPITASMPGANQWNKKMSLKSSITTQVLISNFHLLNKILEQKSQKLRIYLRYYFGMTFCRKLCSRLTYLISF